MITIIGEHPNRNNERDGMVQRIAAIDNLLRDSKRRYLEISLRKHWRGEHVIENGIDVYKFNFFVHFIFILQLLLSSKYIYVHSIYNSIRILPFYYFFKNIVTDLHGIVPDELLMYSKRKKAWLFRLIESMVIVHSFKLIAVTETMQNYYIQKYPYAKEKFIFISIFTNIVIGDEASRKKNGVIYSGGTQKWQCIDKMIELIKDTEQTYEWTILTGDPGYFTNSFVRNNIVVKSVKPIEVEKYYKENSYGVILRKNSIVNKVACPTKLIEYIKAGLIPIVLCPEIGDFYRYGYKYINYDDFKNLKLPNQENLENMRRHNYGILHQIMDKTNKNITLLKKILAE